MNTKLRNSLLAVTGMILFAAAVWVTASFMVNQRPAPGSIRPIEIKNSRETLKASALQWYSFNVPYDGTLRVSVRVEDGNELDIFIMQEDQLAAFRDKKPYRHYPQFEGKKTKNYQRHGQLGRGRYSLIVRDPSFGILSSSKSEMHIQVNLEP